MNKKLQQSSLNSNNMWGNLYVFWVFKFNFPNSHLPHTKLLFIFPKLVALYLSYKLFLCGVCSSVFPSVGTHLSILEPINLIKYTKTQMNIFKESTVLGTIWIQNKKNTVSKNLVSGKKMF
jgi:hypothetical protein